MCERGTGFGGTNGEDNEIKGVRRALLFNRSNQSQTAVIKGKKFFKWKRLIMNTLIIFLKFEL